MRNMSAIAFEVRRQLSADGVTTSLGHVQQLVAAALGHNNLASFQAANEDECLPLANDIVVDQEKLRERASELGCPGMTVYSALDAVLSSRFQNATLHPTLDSYISSLQEFTNREFIDDEDVNSQVAMTNGYMPMAEIELPFWGSMDPIGTADLHANLEGLVVVEQDEDRVYYGHEVEVSGVLDVERLGRRLFGRCRLEVTGARLRWVGESDNDYDEDEDDA